MNLRAAGDEAMLLNQVTGECGKKIGFAETMKNVPKRSAPIAAGVRGGLARAVLDPDLHHAARHAGCTALMRRL